MGKEEIDVKIDYELYWDSIGEVKISDLKHDIEELEKRGATHITIDHGIYYESSYVTIEPICRRLETDEEYAKRLKNQESLNKQRIERELKQLNELRLKYGV